MHRLKSENITQLFYSNIVIFYLIMIFIKNWWKLDGLANECNLRIFQAHKGTNMDVQIIPRINQESFSCSLDEHSENSYSTARIDQSRKWMAFDISLNGNIIKSFSSMEEAMHFRRQLVIQERRVIFPEKNTKLIIFWINDMLNELLGFIWETMIFIFLVLRSVTRKFRWYVKTRSIQVGEISVNLTSILGKLFINLSPMLRSTWKVGEIGVNSR